MEEDVEAALDRCAALLQQRDYDALEAWAPRVAAHAHEAGDTIGAAAAHGFLARGFYARRRLAETVAAYDIAIGLLRRCEPVPAEIMAAYLDNRGLALRGMGRLDEAVESYRAAHEYAGEATAILRINGNLADTLVELGEFDRAIRVHQTVVDGIGDHLDPAAFAVFQDNLALAFARAGDDERALGLYEASAQLLADGPRYDRIVNAANRAAACARLGRMDEASEGFHLVQGLWLEDLRERIDAGRFAEGMHAALGRLLPTDGPVWQTIEEAIAAPTPELMCERYAQAAEGAAEAGDLLTELSCRAIVAEFLHVLGVRGEADPQTLAIQVRDRALKASLTVPVVLADTTLCTILDGPNPPDAHIDRWMVAIEAVVLSTLDDELRELLPGDSYDRVARTDPSVPLTWLGDKAAQLGAHDFAIGHYRDALQLALRANSPSWYVIRAAQLIEALGNAVDAGVADAETYAEDREVQAGVLRRMLQEQVTGAHARTIGHSTLGRWAAGRDPAEALEEHRRAFGILRDASGPDESGETLAPDAGEATVLGVCRPLLLSMIACNEDDGASFEILQWLRARDLMNSYTRRADPAARYLPPDAPESIELLSGLPTPTTLVDIVGTETGLRAYLVDGSGVRTVDATGDTLDLYTVHFGDVRRRAADAVALVGRSPVLRDLVTAIEAAVDPGQALLVVLDDAIANTPIHAVPYGNGFWSDHRSIGRIPAVAMLRHTAGQIRHGSGVVAGDSRRDLPHAARECELVGDILGAHRVLLGGDCTLTAVDEELRGRRPDVIHLALHGRADVRRGGRASLLFAAEGGGTQWAGMDELLQLPWKASLIVLSGCSTAVGGPSGGRGLYGIAQIAAEAGAAATVASLWPVDDESTRVFMTHFYRMLGERLAPGGWIDLRTVLDEARRHLRAWLAGPAASTPGGRIRDGRELDFLLALDDTANATYQQRELLHWAPFILVGDPILRVTG